LLKSSIIHVSGKDFLLLIHALNKQGFQKILENELKVVC